MSHDNKFNLHIFLSSTFDEDVMRHVREAFRNEINARLNNIVGLLGGNTYIYDLQLGIPDGTGALKTLEICFDKIRQSDYFVFMLSEKTGNKNTGDFLQGISSSSCGQSPYAETILIGQKEGLFIIELEAREAEGIPKLNGKRIFFFDRNQTDKARKIAERVKNNCSQDDIILDFTHIDDIKDGILSYFAKLAEEQGGDIDGDEKDRNLYSAGMLRYYVKNDDGLALLNDYMQNDKRTPLVLYGESGSGKSTLLTDWLKDKPDAVVYHVGIQGYTLQEMLSALYKKYWNDMPEDARSGDEQKLTAQFYPFLRYLAHNGKTLLVLDGVNQLSSSNPNIDKYIWLPKQLPDGIKLIVSTTDDISEKGYDICEVPPVDTIVILRRILELEGKELETGTIEAALRDSPLAKQRFPILAHILYQEIVEKFNYANITDELSEHFRNTGTAHDLYVSFLQRTAERFGGTLVKDTLALIWCAKDGLRLEDLHGIIQPHESQEQKLNDLIYLLYHDFSRDSFGRMKFSHSVLENAVKSLYCDNVQSYRDKIISRYESCYVRENEPCFLYEIAHQLYVLNDHIRMEAFLSHVEVALSVYLHSAVLFGEYFRIVSKKNELPYIWEDGIDKTSYWAVSFLAFYYQRTNQIKKALDWRKKALDSAIANFGENHYETAKTYNTIGFCYQTMKQYSDALRYHMSALRICETIYYDNKNEYTGMTCDEIGKDYMRNRDYAEAEKWFSRALQILESTVGTDHLYTARTYNDLMIMRQELKQLKQAEEWGLKAVQSYEAANKSGFPDGETASGYINLAQIYAEEKDYASAKDYASKSLAILEQLKEDNDTLLNMVRNFELHMMMYSLMN